MCDSLAELHRSMSTYAAGFDAALVAPAELEGALRHAGAIEKVAATISSLLAARLAGGAGLGGSSSRARSERRAAEALAGATGTSMSKARQAVETGRRLGSQPEVARAARSGELSRDQAELVSAAAGANPGATARLLELARTGSLSELAGEAGRARAATEDLDERRASVYSQRALRHWTDPSGTWHLAAQGLPDDGAKVMAAIGPLADKAFEEARRQGRRERPEAYAFDGLVALATGGTAGAPGYEVMVRVDHTSLLRGYTAEGETCEVAGFGTVTPQVVLDLMDSADPFLKAIVTKGKDVVGVAHLARRPNAYQKSALDWLFPTCAAEGCGTRAGFLQTDHRVGWALSHVTVFDLLHRLCPHHHRLKTYEGWALVEGRGKRAFVAPGDPRHPRHGAGPPGASAPGAGPPGPG
ncbi:MAG: HNH endonuclease signature motif containing protein [Acidimicrobiales bacterium]